MKWIRTIFFILFFSGITISAAAQERGTLRGSVIERGTGESLPGVNVIIRGTTFGASTDIDGNYEIRNIRPGEYSVEISFVGFERLIFTGIRINEGEVTELNAEIEPVVLTSDDEIIVIGEAPIFDVEKSTSGSTVTRQDIAAAPVRRIEEILSLQAGVIEDPSGLYIKGGRANETGFLIDGVSAQDPLAGTGFGLDLGSNAFGSVDVTTGGVGAEVGDATSGVVSIKTRTGGDSYEGNFTHKRDNFGSNNSRESNFFTDIYELNLGGPDPLTTDILPALGLDLPGKLYFFFTGQVSLSNEFTKRSADDLNTSLTGSDFFSPRQDNRWNGMMKLTWQIKPGMRLEGAYNRSLSINQNTRMLQITGNDVAIQPGFQFPFQENLDNANTFTHDSNLAFLKWTHTISNTAFYEVQVSRLFTRLRADANGRDWRPEFVDGEFDPESIVTFPAEEFEGTEGFTFVLPGDGFVNNGGIATLWHDHFAEEITVQGTINKFFADRTNQLTIGFQSKFNDYQWIDITRPWIGAPIEIEPGVFSQTLRVGERFDAWRVKPQRGAFFVTDKVRFRGLIADVGMRLEYWSRGNFVEEMIDEPRSPIPDFIREEFKDETFGFLGQRYKVRLLPKVRVSFPVRENQVLFFNYGHSLKQPHPTFIYANLDPFFQNQTTFPDLGNPNLNPEVDISYEIGLRNQITANDALNVTAFWRDKFDFVTTQRIIVDDPTGRPVSRAFRVNGDFARSRGIEVTYIKRHRDWVSGQLAVTFSRAEGLSSTSNDNIQAISGEQIFGSNVETPLAWDRPWDIKSNVTFTYDRNNPLFGIDPLNKLQLFVSGTWRSGLRYTPHELRGFTRNPITGEANWRPIYERVSDPAKRFSETGPGWFFVDLNFQKWIEMSGTRFTLFLEISNVFNSDNVAIVNPVTGEAFKTLPSDPEELEALRDDRSFDVPNNVRDPRFQDPRDSGIPAFLNPANFLQQRQIMFGLSVNF